MCLVCLCVFVCVQRAVAYESHGMIGSARRGGVGGHSAWSSSCPEKLAPPTHRARAPMQSAASAPTATAVVVRPTRSATSAKHLGETTLAHIYGCVRI